jgi:transcriptional regulator with GAF, ATPase, and Fis domain
VGDKQRHRRLRLLIKELNKSRKKQAQQIDILCNDLVAAQRSFIKKLKTISFTAGFYESILGATDLNSLLYRAVKQIRRRIDETTIVFFLRQAEGFEIYVFDSERPPVFGRQQLEGCFSQELAESICQSNKVHTLEDIFEMGVGGDFTALSGVSAVTIPLGAFGSSSGFMLICRAANERLTADETGDISAVTSGLSQAIGCCQALSRAAD